MIQSAEIHPNVHQAEDFNDQPEIRLLRGFKIAHLNVNRLVNKLDLVKELVHKHSFDILTLSETWLTPNVMDDEVIIPGYSLVRKDRVSTVKSCGGGVMIFIRDGIPFVVKSDLTKDNFECLWVEVKRPKCRSLTLCCSYRPGDQNIDDFILCLNDALNKIDADHSDFVLAGDLNVDYSTKKNHLRHKLEEFASNQGLSQIVDKPTRATENSSTTIDLIFVNNSHRIVQSGVLDSSISDHNVVFCTIKGGVKKLPPKVFEYRCFKNYDKEAFLEDLNNVPWSAIESTNDVDDALFLWESLLNGVVDDHAPMRTKRVKGKQSPWLTNKLLELRRDRDYHRRKARFSNSKYHWQMYRKLRNFTNREEKRLKSDYYCRLIEDARGDSSRMWKAIKETLPSKHNEINAIFTDGKLQTDPTNIAETLKRRSLLKPPTQFRIKNNFA